MQPISDDMLTTSKICAVVAKCERALTYLHLILKKIWLVVWSDTLRGITLKSATRRCVILWFWSFQVSKNKDLFEDISPYGLAV